MAGEAWPALGSLSSAQAPAQWSAFLISPTHRWTGKNDSDTDKKQVIMEPLLLSYRPWGSP